MGQVKRIDVLRAPAEGGERIPIAAGQVVTVGRVPRRCNLRVSTDRGFTFLRARRGDRFFSLEGEGFSEIHVLYDQVEGEDPDVLAESDRYAEIHLGSRQETVDLAPDRVETYNAAPGKGKLEVLALETTEEAITFSAAEYAVEWIRVKAHPDNAGRIYLSNVSGEAEACAADDTGVSKAIPLDPGDDEIVQAQASGEWFLAAATAGDRAIVYASDRPE